MKVLTLETYQLIKFNWKNFLAFELIYRLITGPLFIRLFHYSLKMALKLAGYSYLTLGNIGYFLVRPSTLLFLALNGLIGLLFLTIEVASLLTGYTSAAYYRKANPIEMLWGGVSKLADEIRRKNFKLLLVVAADYVLINFFLIIFALTQIRPVNILVKNLFEETWAKLLLGGVLCGCVIIAALTIFVFFGCMIEQKSFSDSVYRSKELLKGKYLKSFLLLTGYNVVLTVGVLLAYFICLLIVTVWVVLFVDNKMELAFLIGFNERMQIWFLFIGSICSGLLYFGGTTVQYYQYQTSNHQDRKDFFYSESTILGRRNVLRLVAAVTLLSMICLFDTIRNGNHPGLSLAVDVGITAHRGSSKTAPENTMPAIEAAVEEMADFVEIDVQETKDGVVVLFHDGSLKRTAGLNGSVAAMTWEQLQQIDVGGWFSADYEKTGIPTLEEVLEYSKGKIYLNIEIKNMGNKSQLPEKVLELVNQYGMSNQCVITSTNIKYLRSIKEYQPEIKTGYILSAAYGNYFGDEAVDFISIRSGFVNERVVKSAHEAGKTIHVWTVNVKSEMERLKMLGVDNVITDYPILAREVFYREEATENLLEYLRILLR